MKSLACKEIGKASSTNNQVSQVGFRVRLPLLPSSYDVVVEEPASHYTRDLNKNGLYLEFLYKFTYKRVVLLVSGCNNASIRL